MLNVLLIFLGGGLGSLSRYGISLSVKGLFKDYYPLATFFSNFFSCIILALFIAFFYERANVSPALKFFVITGFCGGFSTFSAFSYETVELFRSGNFAIASANIIINVVLCIAIIFFITKPVH